MRLSHEERHALEVLIKIAETSGVRERVATGWVDYNIHLVRGILSRDSLPAPGQSTPDTLG